MESVKYEWDSNKAAKNKEKHGIDFKVALHAFRDDSRLEVLDARFNPERWRMLGTVDGVLLVVVFEDRKKTRFALSPRVVPTRMREMPIENASLDFKRKPKLSDEVKSLSDADIKARAKDDKDSPPLSGRELADLAPATPRPIRDSLGLTQDQFANLFNIPAATVRDWEQGRVRPDAAGRALLKLIAASPEWAASVFSDEAEVSEEQDKVLIAASPEWAASVFSDEAEVSEEQYKVLGYRRLIEQQLVQAGAIRESTEQLSESIKSLHDFLESPGDYEAFLRFAGGLAGTKPKAKRLSRAAKGPRRRGKTAATSRALDG